MSGEITVKRAVLHEIVRKVNHGMDSAGPGPERLLGGDSEVALTLKRLLEATATRGGSTILVVE